MIDRAIGMAGIALGIIGIVVPILWPAMNKRLAKAALIFGLFLFVVSLIVACWPEASHPIPTGTPSNSMGAVSNNGGIVTQGQSSTSSSSQSSNTMGDVTNNQGIVTQGQQGNNYLQTQKPDRLLDDMLKNKILMSVPRTKRVTIKILAGGDGATERENFANQIDKFLVQQGYEVITPHLNFLPLSGQTTPVGVVIQPIFAVDQPTQILVGTNDR